MSATASIDQAQLDRLVARIAATVSYGGSYAVTLAGDTLSFDRPENVDPRHPGFVGVFDGRAAQGTIRAAVREALYRRQPARLSSNPEMLFGQAA